MDEQSQSIVQTLTDGSQTSLTLQLTLETARSVFNAPPNTSALHLAALAANLMQVYQMTLEDLYRQAEKAGVTRKQFAAVIKQAFEPEPSPAPQPRLKIEDEGEKK